MKQVVRFAATPHGRVAYSVVGSGPPLVFLSGWVSHLGVLWEVAGHRRFVETLARRCTVVRFDRPGCGLSDRGRRAFSLDSELEVLGALVRHLGLRRPVLLGSCDGGQVAAAFAARHPDAVSALLIHGSCARGGDLAPREVRRAVSALVRAHWGLGSRVLADIWLPHAPAELAEGFVRLQRAAASADTAADLLEMFYRTEIADELPRIQAPTLVLHRRGGRAVRFELGRELAALIPGAQLATLEGRSQPIYAEGEDAAAAAVLAFLRDQAGQAPDGVTLTEREMQVAMLITEGLTNAEIGRVLGVSVRTVDAHVEHARAKLGVRARTQIAVWASAQRASA
ncbi:alpha/beta fold hydrolase [Actinomadura sp. ATCC 31491]|uniref:Alpha/beta fold hydrolase n=1 Tax=Actinomadura luzonensis TaxID=2805427 RepID=A0ABT0FU01_9ACTN|nr:alpha/beta fold hydrolase [Actinomadura luzonensis]MCK2215371.1 alpha/beta fold hydrolase [Actinomadura luzonensis]